MSRRLPRLVYTSVSLVIGAAADMSLVVMGGCHHPDNSVAASLITALLVPNVVTGQSTDLVCIGQAEQHLLSSRFKLEISYLK